MKARFVKHTLNFKFDAGTSRGVLKTKDTYFLILQKNDKIGIGECALFRGLSVDDRPDYEDKLQWVCEALSNNNFMVMHHLTEYPSILFGLEQAIVSLGSLDGFQLYPSDFTRGNGKIPINGLIWMGEANFMKQQIEEKIAAGFTTIKIKIGAINFDEELKLLNQIRNQFSVRDIQIRVDANGAFSPEQALEKLHKLAKLQIHSIEQPIKPKQWDAMALLCEKSPIPIALDEELIGVFYKDEKVKLIDVLKPQYIILKPSLLGGISGCNEWIQVAAKQRIGWWITSALESNIGLNAIAQYTYNLGNTLPQGLGTGALFTNNFESPLEVVDGHLQYNLTKKWNVNL